MRDNAILGGFIAFFKEKSDFFLKKNCCIFDFSYICSPKSNDFVTRVYNFNDNK